MKRSRVTEILNNVAKADSLERANSFLLFAIFQMLWGICEEMGIIEDDSGEDEE